MTPELIAIIAVGVALAALILRQGVRLDRRIDALKQEVSERFDKMDERFEKMYERFKSLEDRMMQMVEKQHRPSWKGC